MIPFAVQQRVELICIVIQTVLVRFYLIGKHIGCCASLACIPAVLLGHQHLLIHQCSTLHRIVNQFVVSSLVFFGQRFPYLFALIGNAVVFFHTVFRFVVIDKGEVCVDDPFAVMVIVPFIPPSHRFRFVLECQEIVSLEDISQFVFIFRAEDTCKKFSFVRVSLLKIEAFHVPCHIQEELHAKFAGFDITYIQ